MHRNGLLLIVVGVIAGAFGYFVRSSGTDVETTNTRASNPLGEGADTAKTIADFAEILHREVSARKVLEAEVARLKERITQLGDAKAAEEMSATTSKTNAIAEVHESTGVTGTGDAWFNARALVDAGIDVAVAEQIKTQYETQEMQRLYLRDQAVREGWLRSERYLNELEKLESGRENIRVQYGDKVYDAYLYAAGLPNRVEVDSVLENSPASVAGLQAGDKILSYDNQRIYSGQALRDATAKGTPSETIAIEVERGEDVRRMYLPRGPLGIRMSSVSVAP